MMGDILSDREIGALLSAMGNTLDFGVEVLTQGQIDVLVERLLKELDLKDKEDKEKVENIVRGTLSCDGKAGEVNFADIENIPIIHNKIPVGVVKKYHKSGLIECVIWDKFVETEVVTDEGGENAVRSVTLSLRE